MLRAHLYLGAMLTLLCAPIADARDATAPDVPPPPPMPETWEPAAGDPALEPEVTIRRAPGRTVTEYRVQGRLYMVRVDTPGAPPYYFLDTDHDGTLEAAPWALGPGFLVPHWTLFRW